jgi:hypothetical protein
MINILHFDEKCVLFRDYSRKNVQKPIEKHRKMCFKPFVFRGVGIYKTG